MQLVQTKESIVKNDLKKGKNSTVYSEPRALTTFRV